METHELRCPGCGAYQGTLTLWRPRLPWIDDYFCRPCGENPAVNVAPPAELRRFVRAERRRWAAILKELWGWSELDEIAKRAIRRRQAA